MADPNTRQGKRTPVTLKIKFKSETLEQFIERYAVDVSQGGIFIRTKEPLAVGTQMRFEFQLRDASPLIAGEGTVVWTRENDPSRPAIAPGMGVRFDRLADGSQSVLERILAEKAKQAPSRETVTKPPLFTDTPTRVAPAPVQEALLGNEPRRNTRDFTEKTPLPKAQPFHSDADEFPDEAFEEATKVRALDDLIAQTADDASGSAGDLFSGRPPKQADELAARRGGRADSTLADPPAAAAAANAFEEASSTSPGFASGRGSVPDRDSAPGLPSPPEMGKQPRLLDTTPSPRSDGGAAAEAAAAKAALIAQNDRMEKLAKTRIGMEPAQNPVRAAMPTPAPMPVVARDAPTRPSGIPAADMGMMQSAPVKKGSKAPLIILILLLLAGGGAALWFFVLRDQLVDNNTTVASGSDNKGSAEKPPDDKGSNKGSDVAVGSGSDVGSAANTPPKGPMVDIEITAPFPKANIEIIGTDLKGPAPLKTKLEKDKVYKVRVTAPGFAISETDVKGGTDKWVAKLDPKPYVVTVSSEPAGALIMIDGQPIGHSTPFDVELTKVQVARKAVRVSLRKIGFRPVDKMLDTSAFKEDPAKMMSQVNERLAVQVQIVQPKPPPVGSGSGSGSANTGSATPPTGSDTPPPNPDGNGGGGAGNGGGSAKEPEPDFVKPSP